MKVIRHLLRPCQTDIGGQIGIGTMDPVECRTNSVRFKMDDLTGGMHTGIGPPGTEQADRMISHPAERLLQGFLNTFNA